MFPPRPERSDEMNMRHALIVPGERVLVAVSGGPDSVALLHCLHAARGDLGIGVYAAHLHHGMRDRSALRDQEAVQRLCAVLDVPLSLGREDVRSNGSVRRLGLSGAAREVRYRFLAHAATTVGAAAVATAHTADDQAETVLLRILRGAGLQGLAGIPPVRPLGDGVRLIRPLLDVSRLEVLAYCAAHGLDACQDPSNLSTAGLRNRVRRHLMPLLANQYGEAVPRSLCRLADGARAELEWMEAAEMAAWNTLKPRVMEQGVSFPTNALPAELALRRRLIRRALRACGRPSPSFADVERLRAAIDSAGADAAPPPGSPPIALMLQTGGGLWARVTLDRVEITGTSEPAPPPSTLECALAIPGRAEAPELGVALDATLSSDAPAAPFPPLESGRAVMDWQRLAPPLVVRSRRPGDRIHPLGMKGSRKLQDLFVDAKVPAPKRDTWPVVADAVRVVWVPGLSLSEDVKVTAKTCRFLSLVCAGYSLVL